MSFTNLLCWVTNNVGQGIIQGLTQNSMSAIQNFVTNHIHTTKDIQIAWKESYKLALTSIEIAIKGPAIWSKTSNKEFSITFETEIMEPFCQKFTKEEELHFRQSCLKDIQKLKQCLSFSWDNLNVEEITTILLQISNITDFQQLIALQHKAEEELLQTLRFILGSKTSLIELFEYRNIFLDAIQFHFIELVKENKRIQVHLDILYKKQTSGQISRNHQEILQLLSQISQKQELLFGEIAQEFQKLSQIANTIEITTSHIRQDCNELKAGQLEILCGLKIIKEELQNTKTSVSENFQEFLQLQTDQLLLTSDYQRAREGYLQLVQKFPDESIKYHFFAMVAGIFHELRSGRKNCRFLVEEFELIKSNLKSSENLFFKDCHFLDFSSKKQLSIRFHIEWQGKESELIILSPLLCLRKNPSIRSRFLRNVSLLKKLNSFPFIPKLFFVHSSSTIPYYITNWKEGESLQQYLEKRALNFKEILELAICLCQMILDLHEKEVILRFFRVHNIFYNPPIGLLFHDLEMAKDSQMLDLTQTDLGLSILHELPPNYNTKNKDFLASDIDSFGRTLAYLFTKNECPDKEQFQNTHLFNIFTKCTTSDSQKKYFSMVEVIQELKKIHILKNTSERLIPSSSTSYIKFEVIQGSQPQPDIFYEHDMMLVGRSNDTQCRILSDQYASRIHCILEMNPPQCSIKDLGSSNGTFVNGKRYDKGQSVILNQGDILKIGRTILKLNLHEISEENRQREKTLFDEKTSLNYERIEKIKTVGLWTIYKARHPDTNEIVQLKIAKDNGSFSVSRLKLFLKQMQLFEKLKHPHIIRFYSGDYDGSELHLATEWIEEENLMEQIKFLGPLRLPEAKKIMEQLIDTLDFMHKQGIIHRKIHPKNLYLTKQGLKIADFGIAIHFDMVGLSGLSLYEEKEDDIFFTAPEQIQDYRNIDNRSDIYSVGAVLFYLLTGKPLFDIVKQDPMYIVLDDKIKACQISKFLPDIDISIEKFILNCVEKNIKKRYQNISEVKQNLLHI